MDARVLRTIFDRLRRVERTAVKRSIGLVTDDSPLTVEIGGVEQTNLTKIDTYLPAPGDRVIVLCSGRDRTVLGRID